MEIIPQLLRRLVVTFSRYKVDRQRVLDSEDRIVVNILAGLIKDLCCNGLVAFGKNLLRPLACSC